MNKGHCAARGLFGGSRRFSSTCTILPVVIIFHLFFFFAPALGSFLPEGARGEKLACRRGGLPGGRAEGARPEASTAVTPQENRELHSSQPQATGISRGGIKPS